jgi:LacI family sucrose operon transcriptional repressor
MAEATAMRSLLERQIDGIVLVSTGPVPGDIELFERARVPVVIVGQRVRNVNCVLFDVRGAAYDLATSLGCTPQSKVAYIDAGDRRQSFDIHRRRGFVEGLAQVGVDGSNVTILTGGFTVTSSYNAVREVLAKTGEFDYISCATDTHAAGAIKAIRELRDLGQLPRMPKVSGFGNDPILQAVAGPIPSVEFDYEECGIKAAEMMTALIKGTARSIMSLQLGYRIVGV